MIYYLVCYTCKESCKIDKDDPDWFDGESVCDFIEKHCGHDVPADVDRIMFAVKSDPPF